MKMRTVQLLLLLAMPLSSSAQTLVEGKIFTSPEQRQYLDYLRKDFLAKSKQKNFDIEESQIPDIPTGAPNAPAVPTEYSLDGIMKRADGRLTIWLNRKPLTEQQLPANFHVVREGNAMALRVVSSDGRSQMLRPGQTIEINSGAVQERLHKPVPAPAAPAPATTTAEKAASGPATEPKQQTTGTAEKAVDPAAKPENKTATTADGKAVNPNVAAPNPQSVIESLPNEVRRDPNALDSMIQSLEALRAGLDEDKNQ